MDLEELVVPEDLELEEEERVVPLLLVGVLLLLTRGAGLEVLLFLVDLTLCVELFSVEDL